MSPSSTVVTDWQDIILAAGATLASTAEYERGDVDLVTSDQKLQTKETKRLGSLNIPIVATEYVIQCLIHQTAFDPYQHPRFYSW